MKQINQNFAQLFLRLALSASFLSAVADRFGFWGKPGSEFVSWGNWENFVAYSNSINTFASPQLGNILAIMATALEIILPVFLIIGYKIKYTATISGLLLSAFAILMTVSFKIKTPLDYSVFTSAAAAFILASLQNYQYSLDSYIGKKKV